jgi:hypothetical protein
MQPCGADLRVGAVLRLALASLGLHQDHLVGTPAAHEQQHVAVKSGYTSS